MVASLTVPAIRTIRSTVQPPVGAVRVTVGGLWLCPRTFPVWRAGTVSAATAAARTRLTRHVSSSLNVGARQISRNREEAGAPGGRRCDFRAEELESASEIQSQVWRANRILMKSP